MEVNTKAFKQDGFIPKKYTGFDQDISPEFQLSGVPEETVSIAVMMNDLDIPFFQEYNHWCIWNIPKTDNIPENIPYGTPVSSLSGAIQGVGYGAHRYRGPKPPFFIRSAHRYIFRFYALDCLLELDSDAGRNSLLQAMQGHILQETSIIGKYQR